MTDIIIRRPLPNDAHTLWSIVKSEPALDTNSWFCYFLLCTRFSSTTAVAQANGEIVGFVTGMGTDPNTLFVWQLWVHPDYRGQGHATRLVHEIAGSPSPRFPRLQATIAPGNVASLRVFESLVRTRGGTVEREPYLTAADFPPEAGAHPAEDLITVRW